MQETNVMKNDDFVKNLLNEKLNCNSVIYVFLYLLRQNYSSDRQDYEAQIIIYSQ